MSSEGHPVVTTTYFVSRTHYARIMVEQSDAFPDAARFEGEAPVVSFDEVGETIAVILEQGGYRRATEAEYEQEGWRIWFYLTLLGGMLGTRKRSP
jgi:hypothetical protein